MGKLTKIGYGQVEPNHLSAQRTGQIYAQLAADSALDVVENGMFLKYDLAAGEMNTDGVGEDMLVYSEIKLYDNKRQGYKDFALRKVDSSDSKIYPRLFKTNVGDIFTTNLVSVTNIDDSTIAVGAKLTVVDGVLTETADVATAKMVWNVVKITTMPDGQKAVKVQRIV